MEWRAYQPETDREAVHRIWREVGWLNPKEETAAKALDIMLEGNHPIVALMNNTAECCVLSDEGSMRYQDEEVPFSAVTGVTTSAIARRRGIARRLTAQAVLRGVNAGALVTGLGIFDQGFYDNLGFGTYSYNHHYAFDPATLSVNDKVPEPVRITAKDADAIHESRLKRIRTHGGVVLNHHCHTTCGVNWTENGFGLGYRNNDTGAISHMMWCNLEQKDEINKLNVECMIYQNRKQFLELMGLLKQQADQVVLIAMIEPPGVQLQDLLIRPFRQRELTKDGNSANRTESYACFQMRMNDIDACLKKSHFHGHPIQFNLELTDPVASSLEAGDSWQGVAGKYIVTLGEESSAVPGEKAELPALKASVNAFTRFWLGVRGATSLSYTDQLCGSPELLAALDNLVRLPVPETGWMF